MANTNLSEPYELISGKTSKREDGYSYVLYGKQHYRKRKETYKIKRKCFKNKCALHNDCIIPYHPL